VWEVSYKHWHAIQRRWDVGSLESIRSWHKRLHLFRSEVWKKEKTSFPIRLNQTSDNATNNLVSQGFGEPQMRLLEFKWPSTHLAWVDNALWICQIPRWRSRHWRLSLSGHPQSTRSIPSYLLTDSAAATAWFPSGKREHKLPTGCIRARLMLWPVVYGKGSARLF